MCTHREGVVLLAGELLILHNVRVRPHARVRGLVAHREGIVSGRGQRPREAPLAVVIFPVRDALGPAETNVLRSGTCRCSVIHCIRGHGKGSACRPTGGPRGRNPPECRGWGAAATRGAPNRWHRSECC